MVFGTKLGDDVSLTLWKFLAAGFVIITGAHCTRRMSSRSGGCTTSGHARMSTHFWDKPTEASLGMLVCPSDAGGHIRWQKYLHVGGLAHHQARDVSAADW